MGKLGNSAEFIYENNGRILPKNSPFSNDIKLNIFIGVCIGHLCDLPRAFL